MSSKNIDLLNGPLASSIVRFAVPIALSSMLQQLFNSADTAVVGQFADDNALAAVGTSGEIVGLMVSISSGLSVGANVLAAHLMGSRQFSRIKSAVHSSIFLSLIFGLFIAIAGQFLARPILNGIQTSPLILDQAEVYLKLYLAGFPFLLLYDFASALLRAKGDSRRPFIALTISGILNVGLNLLFVVAFKMNVAGVGLSTLISTAFSCLLVLFWLSREKDEFKFSFKSLAINGSDTVKILKIGIPAAIQGAAFSFANLFIQSAVNSFGPKATAGNSIAVNFEYFAYYVVTAYGQAATTFTSQNYAAGNTDRCKKILKQSILWGIISTAIVSVPLTIFKGQASSVFTPDSQAINYSSIRIMTILIVEFICPVYEVPAGVMRGMGRSVLPSIVTLCGICIPRVTWAAFVFPHIPELFPELNPYQGLLNIHPCSWYITCIAMWIAFVVLMKKQKKSSCKTL